MSEINVDRFWARIKKTETCWLWTGSRTTGGYGNLRAGDGYAYAHRVAYELAHGSIPAGMVIDHLCRVRHCCNPDHLEPVSHAENVRRGAASYGPVRTECKHGHDITDPANVYTAPGGDNRCRVCAMERQMAKRSPNWPRTHCPQGHAYTEENTYVTRAGHRQCRACNRIRSAARHAAKRRAVA